MFLMSGPTPTCVNKHNGSGQSLGWFKQGEADAYFRWDSLHAHLEFWVWVVMLQPFKAEMVQASHLLALEPVHHYYDFVNRGGD